MDREEKECFKNYVELMCSVVDNTKDPCEDFVSFACGNFDYENRFHSALNAYTSFERDILHSEDLSSYSALSKARRFHQSYPADVKSFVRHPSLRQVIGGWAALDEEWTGEHFHLAQIAGALSAFGCNILFRSVVEYAPRGRVVKLCRNGPSYYWRAQLFFSGGRVEDLLGELEIREDKVPEIVNDINLIAEKIHLIPRDITALNIMTRLLPEEIRNRPELNYEQFLEAFLGEQITEEDVFFISAPYDGSFERYLTMLQELEPRVLSNYLLLLVADQFSPCNPMTMKQLAPIVMAGVFEQYFNKKDEEDYFEIYKRFGALTDKSGNLLNRNNNRHPRDAYNVSRDVIELKNEYFTVANVEKEYENLEIVSDDYFQNVLNIQRFGVTESCRKYHSLRHEVLRHEELLNILRCAKRIHNKPFLLKYCTIFEEFWRRYLIIDMQNEKCKLMKEIFQKQLSNLNLLQSGNGYFYEIRTAVIKSLLLKIAFEDYKKWLEENEDVAREQEEILKEFGLNNLQAFFLCWEVIHKDYNPDIVNMMCYSNLEEFLEVFKNKTPTLKAECKSAE